MIRAGIIGSTGYAGAEIARLLLKHKEVEIKWLVSRSFAGQPYEDIFRNLFEVIEKDCSDISIGDMADEADVIFTATPQGYLQGELKPEILDKCRIIDMSADYRIKDVSTTLDGTAFTVEMPGEGGQRRELKA